MQCYTLGTAQGWAETLCYAVTATNGPTTHHHAMLLNNLQHLKITRLCWKSAVHICISCQCISYFYHRLNQIQNVSVDLQPTMARKHDVESLLCIKLNSQVSLECPLHLQNSSLFLSPEFHRTPLGAFLFPLARDKMCWEKKKKKKHRLVLSSCSRH